MPRKTVAIVATLVAVVVLLAGLRWTGTPAAGSEGRAAPALTPEVGPVESDPQAPEAGTPRAPAFAMASLPPPDAPLATVFDALAEAADAGDVRASCRLAWDLKRCQTLDARQRIPDFHMDSAAHAAAGSTAEAELIGEVIAAQNRVARDRAMCEGLTDDRLAQSSQRMLQAARLGHAPSQSMFAMWPSFGSRLSLDDVDIVAFHRDNAMTLLRRAAAHGEPTALFGLMHACHFGELRLSHGTIEVGRDPACAMATALALRGVADPRTIEDADEVIRESAAQLDAEARDRVRRQADAYRSRLGAQPLVDLARGIFAPYLQSPCQDLGAQA